jgi:hypothetical protein
MQLERKCYALEDDSGHEVPEWRIPADAPGAEQRIRAFQADLLAAGWRSRIIERWEPVKNLDAYRITQNAIEPRRATNAWEP